MNFNEYLPLALRTAKPMATPHEHVQHAALGLVTEVGEFVSEVKRIVIYETIMSDDIRAHMLKELGDVTWYIPVLLHGVDSAILPAIESDQVEVLSEQVSDLRKGSLLLGMLSGAVSAAAAWPGHFDREEIRTTCASLIFAIDRIAELLGSSGDEIRAANIEKLRARYPDGYSNVAAEARADTGGANHRIS